MINPDERLTILANKNVSRGKMAAAAVHAALMHYGIPHGAVIVLGASPGRIEDECSLIIRDAGRTEVEPGTVTAGVREGEVDTQRHALLDAATELAHKLRNPYRPEPTAGSPETALGPTNSPNPTPSATQPPTEPHNTEGA